ncbi:phosphoribosyltransferase [Alkalilimnicola ehrlichii MLHE-1]|nr:phosphoribosyltransferase [Alkalilimnicola ehrlichii]
MLTAAGDTMNGFQGFSDRTEAGRALARELVARDYPRPVVYALPRGGVPVAFEVAEALDAPLDLLMVRKIGVPWQPELALAAVVNGDRPEVVINEDVWRAVRVSEEAFERAKAQELETIRQRRALYLQGRERPSAAGATAIVIDDGIATGATMRVALKALRRASPERLILAVPVAPADTVVRLRAEVDELICLATPTPFQAIGLHYRDFHQVSDDEVIVLLDRRQGAAAR